MLGIIVAEQVPYISISYFVWTAISITAVSIVFNQVAYKKTVNAFRYSGTSIERNPVARFLFRRIGSERMRWFGLFGLTGYSAFFFLLYYLMFGVSVFQYTILLGVWSTLIIITGVDALNDVLATRTMNYLMTHDNGGWVYQRFLPRVVV